MPLEQQKQDDGPVECRAIDRGVSHGLSDDKQHAMLVLQDEAGDRLALTLPVDRLRGLRSMLNDLIDALDRAKTGAGQVLLKRPTRRPLVGHSEQYRGHVVLGFEAETQDESVWILPDRVALELIKDIEHNVITRTSPTERAKLMSTLARPQIIMPGR